MPSNNLVEEVHRQMVALVEPLREQVSKLDAEIANRESEVKVLRAARREAAGALRLLDPQPVQPKAKKNGGKSVGGIAPATLQAITDWLRERKDELNIDGGFRANAVAERDDYTATSRATFQKAIPVLRDQNIIVLDHIGGRGGIRHWKVT